MTERDGWRQTCPKSLVHALKREWLGMPIRCQALMLIRREKRQGPTYRHLAQSMGERALRGVPECVTHAREQLALLPSALSPSLPVSLPILGLPAFPLSLCLLSWSLCISLAAMLGVCWHRRHLLGVGSPWPRLMPHTHTHSHQSSSAPATESPGGLTHS